MSNKWPAVKPRVLLAALERIGWTVKRHHGTSHRILSRPGWPNFTFSFHDGEEINSKALPRIARRTGLTPDDLH